MHSSTNSANRSAPQKVEGPVKVVGFHVEGASPSPRPDSLRDAVKSGSLYPVIIPPTFQGQQPRATPDSSPKKVQERETIAIAPINIHPVDENPSDHSGGALPLTPLAASAPATMEATTTNAIIPADGADKQHNQVQTTHAPATSPKKVNKTLQDTVGQNRHQPPPKKEMTKAERRALQEAQRAAKAAVKTAAAPAPGGKQHDAAASGGAGAPSSRPLAKTSSTGSMSAAAAAAAAAERTPPQPTSTTSTTPNGDAPARRQGQETAQNRTATTTALFSHLPQFKHASIEKLAEQAAAASIPIECMRLGLQMADGSIRGANARCIAVLDMFLRVIEQFKVSPGKSFLREFSTALNAMISYLVTCRPLSPAMGNVVKAVKAEIGRLNAAPDMADHDARSQLLTYISTFAHEKIHYSKTALAKNAAERIIHEDDVILTYSYSSTVEAVLLAAADMGRRFSVTIIDARPMLEGRMLLRRLLVAGIPCEYILLNGLDIGLTTANKVLVGACAVMSNGAVLSRVGTAAVAMSASAAHVPVIVCAETYKFAERVQLDSVTYNELGNPTLLLPTTHGDGDCKYSLLNILYDSTPAEFVSVVMTEVGALPPTSVPVVLREFSSMFLGSGAV